MKSIALGFFVFLLVACEPIGAEKDKLKENSEAALSNESGTGSIVTDGEEITNSEIFFNLSSSIRSQYLAQVQETFSNLSIMIDGSRCSLSHNLSIVLPGEITPNSIDAAFTSIRTKIEECLGVGEDRVQIRALDLVAFERDLEAALGNNIVKACVRDSDCARFPSGRHFTGGLGYVYSKKIQGLESEAIHAKTQGLLIDLADSETTNYDGFSVSEEDIPSPLPVVRCVSNSCRSVRP